jgi:hypothetical protein
LKLKEDKMRPGPTLVYKCPICGKIVRCGSLLSGNTFDAKLYSDGKQIAPMLPEFPGIVKCGKCSGFYWLNDENKTGEYKFPEDKKEEWGNAVEARFLSMDEIIEAIDLKIYKNNSEEFYLRVRLWWAFNDRIREGKNIFVDQDDKNIYESNCKNLINIIDKNNISGKIMSAELLRNLSNYIECNNMLETIREEEYTWIKILLKKECENKNSNVIELEQ